MGILIRKWNRKFTDIQHHNHNLCDLCLQNAQYAKMPVFVCVRTGTINEQLLKWENSFILLGHLDFRESIHHSTHFNSIRISTDRFTQNLEYFVCFEFYMEI